MEDCHTLTFIEPDSNEEVCVIVRRVDGRIALTLSRRLDGDVEVVLSPDDARQLITWLQDSLPRTR